MPIPDCFRNDRTKCRHLIALSLAALVMIAGCARPNSGLSGHGGADSSWSKAMQSAREAAATPSAASHHEIARLYAAADSSAMAWQWSESALRIDPDYNPALSLWSKLMFERGENDRAVEVLEAAHSRQGTLPEALRAGLALHYDALGRWEDSEREFDLVKTPRSAKVYHVLRGDSFLEAGTLAEAALENEPNSAASHNNFGITRLYAGDPETARRSFLHALELEPDLSGAMYNLAIVETFYFFDEEKGRDWFGQYRATGSEDDPDGLAETLAIEGSSSIGEQARR